uniref:Secreted protein n=1 Tax=Rhipicephalus appendiculatus TaxID=34631 RepID=A0A131YBP9_RHIAP
MKVLRRDILLLLELFFLLLVLVQVPTCVIAGKQQSKHPYQQITPDGATSRKGSRSPVIQRRPSLPGSPQSSPHAQRSDAARVLRHVRKQAKYSGAFIRMKL